MESSTAELTCEVELLRHQNARLQEELSLAQQDARKWKLELHNLLCKQPTLNDRKTAAKFNRALGKAWKKSRPSVLDRAKALLKRRPKNGKR